MFDMKMMMGYSAVNRRQSMLSAKVKKRTGDGNTAESRAKTEVAQSGKTKTDGKTVNAERAGEFAREVMNVEERSDSGQNPAEAEQNPLSYGAEADFAVSGRAREVAGQMRSFFAWEQEMSWNPDGQTAPLQENRTKREEETEYQKYLRERLEQARSLDTMFRRMRELNEQAKKKQTQKKKVQYSYRRVSAAISGAKTSTQASLALSTASANLSSLKRKAASGQYESKEMEIAIAHAQKMVRVARKKVQNIKWEVQQQKRNRSREDRKKQQNSMIHSTPRKAKEEKALLRLKTQLKAQERSKKHRNRREEDVNLISADMQYLQRKIDLLKQGTTQGTVTGSPVVISGGVGSEISEVAAETEKVQTIRTAAESMSTAAAEGGSSEVSTS